MSIIWDFVRQLDAAALPGGTTSYFDTTAQALYLDSTYIKTMVGQLIEGQWQDIAYGSEIEVSESGYSALDILHEYNGILYGTADHNGQTVFFMYEYMIDVSAWLSDGEWVEQPDNPIKVGRINIFNADKERFSDTNGTIFAPGSRVILKLQVGEEELYDIGVFYLYSSPFNETDQVIQLQGKNLLGHYLSEQTFDTLISITGTRTAIVAAIFAHAGMTDTMYEIETDATAYTVTFTPEQMLIDGITKLCDQWSWYMDDLPDGQVIIGSATFVRTHKLTAVYTFNRGSEVFSRPIQRSMDGVYSRAAVHREKPVRHIYSDVPHFDAWFLGQHRTYHYTVAEEVTNAQMDTILAMLVEDLQYMGVVESVLSPMRPWLQIGDVAKMIGDAEERIVGIMSTINQMFGASGFFTEFSVTSGGIISNPENPATIATKFAGKLGGANRKKRITDYIQQSSSASTGGAGGIIGNLGPEGLSAYEVWLSLGNTGTEQDFIDAMTGADGTGMPTGGTTDQLVAKNSNTDYDFKFVDPVAYGNAYFKKASSTFTDNDTAQTFTDTDCTADTLVVVVITSATVPQGVWSIESSAGSFTITSTESETADITFDYYIQKAVI